MRRRRLDADPIKLVYRLVHAVLVYETAYASDAIGARGKAVRLMGGLARRVREGLGF